MSSQSGSAWFGCLPGGTFAQEHDVGDDRRAFALEGIGRQADRPQEIRLARPDTRGSAAFCLSSVKWLVTTARTPPGFRASSDLAMKKSCSGSFWPR